MDFFPDKYFSPSCVATTMGALHHMGEKKGEGERRESRSKCFSKNRTFLGGERSLGRKEQGGRGSFAGSNHAR